MYKVAGLYQYPLTGAQAVELGSAEVRPSGMQQDRNFVLYDPNVPADEPNRVSFKQARGLARVLAFPVRFGEADYTSLILQAGAGYSDRLMIPKVKYDEPDCIVNEFGDQTPAVDRGERAAALFSDFLGMDVRLAEKHPSWLAADYPETDSRKNAPLHIVTSSSVREIASMTAAAKPGAKVNKTRFRPNIVIDNGDEEPFAENRWVGRFLSFGNGLTVYVQRATERCPVPGYDPRTGENLKDVPKVYQKLQKSAGGKAIFGVYGYPITSGKIQIGGKVVIHD